MNTLYFGDNLDILREYIDDESVDLIYLDPPFNSQAQYNVLFQTVGDDAIAAQAEAFRDTWVWGEEADWAFDEIRRSKPSVGRIVEALHSALGKSDMMAYLVMMAVRLEELRHKLKPTGSLYLHCDPNASHYLKIMLDAIFGGGNFRSELIWKRTSAHSGARRWGPIHDTILFLTASSDYTWNKIHTPYEESYIKRYYKHVDKDGNRYRLSDLTGSGTRKGESGKPWGGFDPTEVGRHWAIPGDVKKELDGVANSSHGWLELIAKAGQLDTGTDWPHVRRYLDKMPGVAVQDIITDIKPLSKSSAERMGYPTQKPLTLLERIIESSSNEGDVVLDPFCGCGTTIEAAHSLKRQWLGVDVAIHAIKVIEARLTDRLKLDQKKYKIEGMPRDFESAERLAERDRFQFQWWANYLFDPHALREQTRGPDRGIDGEMLFPNGPGPWGRMLTSVKSGTSIAPAMVREFRGVLEREKATMGLFISLYRPTKAMEEEASEAGPADTVHGDIPKLQIVAIQDFFEGKLPKLPPLEHLPTAAFSTAKRRAKAKTRRPDATQPELPFVFSKQKKEGSKTHFNPNVVHAKRKKSA